MNGKAFSLAAGILWGFLLFVFTLIETARGAGRGLAHLSAVYPGYAVTYLGSVIGLVYGFVSAAIVGLVFCWLYARLSPKPEGPKTAA
ncbi:MAG: hypothetical protein ABSC23_12080 [Bryobacteraceae bacterium]|jgi:hypothetical protein